ncbi:substrate-binding domain-containing protein [Simiduia agarivorans]|uniref:OmpA family protein n=1 Tax=Simiduia agarivorans (strain DSM 21679 / JCM 13881 / BCRC 17597 / SA1) TaxID=1117647 RepID=K4KWJ4_SIMAS|nr:substrate-binding domain-containing protein [Simiduia agarivorans]AFU98297.1 OmpA family protein [Simiduia agarivorans SA1 = DSM 21679]
MKWFAMRLWALFLAFSLLFSVSLQANDIVLEPFDSATRGKLFTVKGSNTVGAALMPALVEAYLLAKGANDVIREPSGIENESRIVGTFTNGTQVFVDIAAHGSSTSFQGLADGSADLGMSSRPIKPTEAESLAHLDDMQSFEAEKVLAIDGLAVIVHPENNVARLTTNTVARIFAGEIKRWSELGGKDIAINLYARDDKSGTWDTFSSLVLGKTFTLDKHARRFESNDALSGRVAGDPGGIGFVGLAAVNRAKPLAIYDEGTEPLLPSQMTVATEDYRLSRRLFLYMPPASDPLLAEFVAFAQSAAGQTQVANIGYVSQVPIAVTPDLEGITNEDYLQAVTGAERLSVNIRFREGSAELDNKARQDILRLAALMQSPDRRHQKILLVGFGDTKDTESRSRVLSKLRATQVKSALYQLGIGTQPVQGFGAIMPVDGTDKTRNQRVEIWLTTEQ